MIFGGLESYFDFLMQNFGYGGVFLISLISAATIIFPIPGFAAIPIGAHFLHPLLVAIVGALGSSIGELVAYGAARGGISIGDGKFIKWSERLAKWFEKINGFTIIILFAATPLPHDVVGLFAGIIKYDIKKFFLATLIGKFLMFLVLAYGIGLIFP
ncbi:MAG TPA: hypothetical protein ENI04_00350 [Candidatus Wildermuthbacteria bacterium]|nr:VTT domain-containing protein [Patescibacteria group bacterium]HEA84424.1 hypothetical protein [Candidatus Wildermuthbacteria bacterium]